MEALQSEYFVEKLSNELLLLVFCHLDAFALGRVLKVCKHWRELGEDVSLWKPLVESLQIFGDVSFQKYHSFLLKSNEYKRVLISYYIDRRAKEKKMVKWMQERQEICHQCKTLLINCHPRNALKLKTDNGGYLCFCTQEHLKEFVINTPHIYIGSFFEDPYDTPFIHRSKHTGCYYGIHLSWTQGFITSMAISKYLRQFFPQKIEILSQTKQALVLFATEANAAQAIKFMSQVDKQCPFSTLRSATIEELNSVFPSLRLNASFAQWDHQQVLQRMRQEELAQIPLYQKCVKIKHLHPSINRIRLLNEFHNYPKDAQIGYNNNRPCFGLLVFDSPEEVNLLLNDYRDGKDPHCVQIDDGRNWPLYLMPAEERDMWLLNKRKH